MESAGSWDRGRVEELQRELEAIVPDISRLENLAASLDSSLCKGIFMIDLISYYLFDVLVPLNCIATLHFGTLSCYIVRRVIQIKF